MSRFTCFFFELQIVAEMRKVGTDSFLDSQSLLQSCLISGLLPSHYDALRPSGEKVSIILLFRSLLCRAAMG